MTQEEFIKYTERMNKNIPSDNTTCDTKIIQDIEKIIYEVEE